MAKESCVFVIDRDSSARSGLARLLRTAGHSVRDFASAEEFLDAFYPKAFGCLVLDLSTGGASGDELRVELETRGVNLPIIVLTADGEPDTWREAQELKAAEVFRKPVDGRALLDAIDWAIRLHDAGDNHTDV